MTSRCVAYAAQKVNDVDDPIIKIGCSMKKKIIEHPISISVQMSTASKDIQHHWAMVGTHHIRQYFGILESVFQAFRHAEIINTPS